MSEKQHVLTDLSKVPTGIPGFDMLSSGGLPLHRTTLVVGGPGAGKSIFALQTLVNQATLHNNAGMFVAFEERPEAIITNAATFGWDLGELRERRLFFLDAHLSPAAVRNGEFDLAGMLAILRAQKEDMGATTIVFDGVDVLLTLLRDPVLEMQELYRIRDWLSENHLTGILTAKVRQKSPDGSYYRQTQFMADCVIRFDRRLAEGVSEHTVQIQKYRGSGFSGGSFPVIIGPKAMEISTPDSTEIRHKASRERISIGFERLDSMLGGGLYRGSSTLITGAPGTSKTTLSAKFAESAVCRGERTLYVSFDEGADPIIRNLTSVGIDLQTHVDSGVLRIYAGRTEALSPEEHLIKLRTLMEEHRPQCMVIDPISAIAKLGREHLGRNFAGRLLYAAKDRMITTVVTSLINVDGGIDESTDLDVSTIADTWIHLSYLVRSGERNRALTIVKSRGTSHSNQVRELTLSENGPDLTDVYTEDGEVLMGTLRWEKEMEANSKRMRQGAEADYRRRQIQSAAADTKARITSLQRELEAQQAELTLQTFEQDANGISSTERENALRRIRSTDAEINSRSTPSLSDTDQEIGR